MPPLRLATADLPPPDGGFAVEVDGVPAAEWDGIAAGFDDVTWDQTACWVDARWGAARSSHLLLRRRGVPVAGARVVVLRPPACRRGIAYVKFGPFWRRHDADVGAEKYRAAVLALWREYAVRRGHHLTVLPRHTPEHADTEHAVLDELGFVVRRPMVDPNRYVVDLALDASEQAGSLDQKWRYNLRRALRRRIDCEVVAGERGLAAFAALHEAMVARKRFPSDGAVRLLPALDRQLPETMRPRVVLAAHRGRPVAGAVVAICGDTAFYLFGASDDAALPLAAGYALQWWIVRWLARQGPRWYDLGGEALTPGLGQFKKGLVGKRGVVLRARGELDRWTSVRARLAADCLYIARDVQRAIRSLRHGGARTERRRDVVRGV